MFLEEGIIRSSIQLFLADPVDMKPVEFGSAFLVIHREKLIVISVSHVTDKSFNTYLESNLPSDKWTTPLNPVGNWCYINLLDTKGITLPSELLEEIEQGGKRLDIAFAEYTGGTEFRQAELVFPSFTITEGKKMTVNLDAAVIPDKYHTYGFFGNIKHHYNGIHLVKTPTLKHSLKYHGINKNVYVFIAPEQITDSKDYEGCSGAPIFDNEGRVVAVAIKVATNSKMIFGFPIQECIKLLDFAIDANCFSTGS